MANYKAFYGIKYPFTCDNNDGHFIDLNNNEVGKLASQILFVLLTRKRTKIMDPDFGTDLSKYIFEPNESKSWDSIKNECVTAVAKYVKNVNLTDIRVFTDEKDDNSLYLYLTYSVNKGNLVENNELGIRII